MTSHAVATHDGEREADRARLALSWRLEGFDWVALLLLLLLFRITTWSLTAADWTDHLVLVGTLAWLGVGLGAWFGWSLFSGRVAAATGLVYGAIVTTWLIGTHVESSLVWRDRALEVGRRLSIFLRAVATGRPNDDGLMFVLLLGLVFWGAGMLSGFRQVRRRSLGWVIFPVGLALVLNAYAFLGKPDLRGHVALFALIALVLAARMELRRRQGTWRGINARVPSDVVYSILLAGVLAAGTLVFAAWVGPAFAQSEMAAEVWSKATRPWMDLRQDLGESLRGLRRPAAYLYEVYGNDLALKAGSELEHDLVLRVTAAELGENQGRYYWRARVYTKYEGGKWLAASGDTIPVYPRQPGLVLADELGRDEVEVAIEPLLPGLRTLYVLAQPVWVSRQTNFAIRQSGEQVQDVTEVSVPGVVVAGESYRVRAMHASPTADQLRSASSAYPGWVMTNDLQLPPEITDRTRALAEQITAPYDTPFDKTGAVVRWLRTNIDYSRVTEAPPEAVEPLDWFLFDYRTGFCEWYASAAVVLLRQAGIPARMAAGYAQGTPRQAAGNTGEMAETDVTYEVYGTDLHTWPEVYFPQYGWVEFEPTGGQPELVRPEGSVGGAAEPLATPAASRSTLEGEAGAPFEGRILDEEFLTAVPEGWQGFRLALVAPAGLAGLVLLVLAWLWVDPGAWTGSARGLNQGMRRLGLKPPRRLERLAAEDLTLSAAIYQRWSGWLPRLGLRTTSATTAHERADLLAASHPGFAEPSRQIVETYARERYGGDATDARGLRSLWRRLELRMLFAWLSRGMSR